MKRNHMFPVWILIFAVYPEITEQKKKSRGYAISWGWNY